MKQYLLFPDGMMYNKKNNTVRTSGINTLFMAIAHQQSIVATTKKDNLFQIAFLVIMSG
ncbi:MAG: hypothetical protein KGK14_10985 [Bacteroidota bacterium]|nr:hypothetical protein [Bacteroidota bacterium]